MNDETVTVALTLPAGALAVQAAPPELVSQRTAEAVLGIPRRSFLEAVRTFEAAGGVVLHLGKLRLVRRDAFIGWLRTRREQVAPEANGADALAAELGLRAVAGGRR